MFSKIFQSMKMFSHPNSSPAQEKDEEGEGRININNLI